MFMAAYFHAFWFSALLLVLQPWHANGNIFSPIIEDIVCDMMQCGKGTCQPSKNSSLGFVCECHDGWEQANFPQFHGKLTFLPCLIPNCTINSTCAKEEFSHPPSTAPEPNPSTFNPCHWTNCGGGTCNRTSLFNYRCQCEEGYDNMFKIPIFPCYKQCAFQDDCSPLGINMTQAFTPDSSAANTLTEGDVNLMIFRAICVLGMLMVML